MIKKYYDVNSKKDYDVYTQKQIEMWHLKSNKHRSSLEYAIVSRLLETKKLKTSSNAELICLGARNNWERDNLKKYLSFSGIDSLEAYSLDIAPQSEVNYHYDFEKLPKSWTDRFDIIYTNAADHSFNFKECFKEWKRIMKPNGVLILGISDQDILNDEIKGVKSKFEGTVNPNPHGCTVFDVETVDAMCSDHFKTTTFIPRDTYQLQTISADGHTELHSHFLNYHYWFNYGK
jgi:SAM-dependent methyltransferase